MSQPVENPSHHSDRTSAARSALVIASWVFEDARLSNLHAPQNDARELARVLSDSEIGDFEVKTSLNEAEHIVRRKIATFFADRSPDDLLLLHVSCHGIKDEDGALYFAAPDTDVHHLDSTAIAADFVNRQMSRSRSRRIVLLLDCCYSGAFGRDVLTRSGSSVDLKERFDGRGRVVITASNAMEYALDGDDSTTQVSPSVFTAALVEGLESGRADGDGDGLVSVDDLYDFVYADVRSRTPNQTPSKWTFDLQGDIMIARSSASGVIPADLPTELRDALNSLLPSTRGAAVSDLARMLASRDRRTVAAARLALEAMMDDDSRSVAAAAALALESDPSSQGRSGDASPAEEQDRRTKPPPTRKPTVRRPRTSEKTESSTPTVDTIDRTEVVPARVRRAHMYVGGSAYLGFSSDRENAVIVACEDRLTSISLDTRGIPPKTLLVQRPIAVAPDGELAALTSGLRRRTLSVCSPLTGAVVAKRIFSDGVRVCRISCGRRTAAVWQQDGIHMLDAMSLATRSICRDAPRFSPDPDAFAVSDAGDQVAVATGSEVIWFQCDDADWLTSRRTVVPLSVSGGRFTTSLTFSPSGELLGAVEASGAIHIWNAKTREEVQRVSVPDISVRARNPYRIAFDRSGRRLAISGPAGQSWIRNLETGSLAAFDANASDDCLALAFSRDGLLLCRASRSEVDVWHVAVHPVSGDTTAKIGIVPRELTVRVGLQDTFNLSVRNEGTRPDRFTIALIAPSPAWAILAPLEVSLLPGDTFTADVLVRPEAITNPGADATVVVQVASVANPSSSAVEEMRVRVVER